METETGFPTPGAAERAFYAAFADCDLPAMNRVWADDGVICIHPGAAPLAGREAVLSSWARILGGSSPPDLRVVLLSRTERDGLAVHVVEESISQGPAAAAAVVVATNVYLLTAAGWRLIEHHASAPGLRQREDIDIDAGTSHRPPRLQ